MTIFDLAEQKDKRDIAILDGDLVFAEGAKVIEQEIDQVVETDEGEWFLDGRVGLDQDKVRGKNPPIVRDSEIIKTILSVPEVTDLESFTAEVDRNRLLDWDYEANISVDGGEETDSQDFGPFNFDAGDLLGDATLDRSDDNTGTSDHVRPRPGYLLNEDNNYTWHVLESDISHDRIDQSTIQSDDHHHRYTDAEARAAAASQVTRYEVPLSDLSDGTTRDVYVLTVPSGAEIDIIGLGIHTQSGGSSSDLEIRVDELGGSTLVSTTDNTDPVGYNLTGSTTAVVRIENTGNSNETVGGYVDFKVEWDSGPDEVGRYTVPLTDIRDTEEIEHYLVTVRDGKTAEISRGGVHLEDGTAPSGLSMRVTDLNDNTIVTTGQNDDTFSASVSGPEQFLVKIDNQTGADVTAGAYLNFTIS